MLGPDERPSVLWGRGGLCGEEQPCGGVSRTKLFVNLTAGLELLRYVPAPYQAGIGFCHLRSTHLERSAYEHLVRDLDCGLLFNLACGVHCAVLDAGSAREDGVSRAVWQGLEFVRYLLSSRWLGRPTQPAAAPQFARHARELSDVARRKVWLASPSSNSEPSP